MPSAAGAPLGPRLPRSRKLPLASPVLGGAPPRSAVLAVLPHIYAAPVQHLHSAVPGLAPCSCLALLKAPRWHQQGIRLRLFDFITCGVLRLSWNQASMCMRPKAAHRVGEHGDGVARVCNGAEFHNATALGCPVLMLQICMKSSGLFPDTTLCKQNNALQAYQARLLSLGSPVKVCQSVSTRGLSS